MCASTRQPLNFVQKVVGQRVECLRRHHAEDPIEVDAVDQDRRVPRHPLFPARDEQAVVLDGRGGGDAADDSQDLQSALMFASWTTLAQRSTSLLRNEANCSGVPATTSTPSLPKRSLVSAEVRIFTISVFRRFTISRGVPATVRTPNQTLTS